MKRPDLDPSVLRVVRIATIAQAFAVLVLRRSVAGHIGIDVPLVQWLAVTLTVPLLLVAYTWIPWWQRRLGRAFLPLFLVIAATNLVVDKYLTLAWIVAPEARELTGLLLIVRVWIILQVIALIAGWQYPWRWTLAASFTLSIVDGALSLPFTSRDSVLYSLYLALLAARTFIVCALSAGMGWLLDRQREQERALDEANLKLVHHASTIEELAISQERNRLARELHDTLAHSLTATAVQLEAVSAVWEADERAARDMLGQALHTTRAGLSGARRALQALRASPLEEVGLAVAVGNLARSAAARANLTLELDVPPRLDHVPPDIAQCVYRVAEEALANVVRHAKARQLVVALACANDHLSLAIADDGCGFGPADVEPARYGLKGMRERAELIGGLLTVAPTHGGGTTVKLNVGG